MTERIAKTNPRTLKSMLRHLEMAGATTDHAKWLRKASNAAQLLEFMNQEIELLKKNPNEMTVEQQLDALRHANNEEHWGISEEVFTRLAATAPAWPKGKYALRSLRIRFGEYDDGVAQTFKAHCDRIRHVLGNQFGFDYTLGSRGAPIERRVRLACGNRSHRPSIKWVVFRNITKFPWPMAAVPNAKLLADDGLVLAWMFPGLMCRRHCEDPKNKLYSLRLIGYEIYVEEADTQMQGLAFGLAHFNDYFKEFRRAHLYACHLNRVDASTSPPTAQK